MYRKQSITIHTLCKGSDYVVGRGIILVHFSEVSFTQVYMVERIFPNRIKVVGSERIDIGDNLEIVTKNQSVMMLGI